MGRNGSSGGRVSGGDKARVDSKSNGKFAVRNKSGGFLRREFDSRKEAQSFAREERASSSRAGIKASAERSREAIRTKLRGRNNGD